LPSEGKPRKLYSEVAKAEGR